MTDATTKDRFRFTLLHLLPLLVGLPMALGAEPRLYGPQGIAPEAVRQGRLGSCYFHAVVAALADTHPESLRRMIRENSDGTYRVEFADGRAEIAYPEDIRYSREIGYDLSDGWWVAVLFRAYAQKVLRRSLADAIDQSDMPALVKPYARDLVLSSDAAVLAYDRAIRSQVEQNGNIDRAKLQEKLKQQLSPVPISTSLKDSLVGELDSGGFFDALAQTIRQNGELFGAYRAVGQGGIAEQVMETLAGTVRTERIHSERQASAVLTRALAARQPAVACTGGSRFYDQVAAGKTLPPETEAWYVNGHCYTVLGFDAASGTVKLRNPWAHHPDPDGVFSLPVAVFLPAFYGLVTPGPPPKAH